MLGAGESGKSTFVKQMKILHKDEFKPEELNAYRIDLLENVIEGIKNLIEGMDTLNIEYEVSMYFNFTIIYSSFNNLLGRKRLTSMVTSLRF